MADPVAQSREGLRDRYAFERELGRGGMATDLRLPTAPAPSAGRARTT